MINYLCKNHAFRFLFDLLFEFPPHPIRSFCREPVLRCQEFEIIVFQETPGQEWYLDIPHENTLLDLFPDHRRVIDLAVVLSKSYARVSLENRQD